MRDPTATLGMLPVPRRDVERLRQILALQRRLTDMQSSPRAKRALTHRGPFAEALTWLEIHGHAPEIVEHWHGFLEAAGEWRRRPPSRPIAGGARGGAGTAAAAHGSPALRAA